VDVAVIFPTIIFSHLPAYHLWEHFCGFFYILHLIYIFKHVYLVFSKVTASINFNRVRGSLNPQFSILLWYWHRGFANWVIYQSYVTSAVEEKSLFLELLLQNLWVTILLWGVWWDEFDMQNSWERWEMHRAFLAGNLKGRVHFGLSARRWEYTSIFISILRE
jgi:hypothetical protein